MLTWTPSKESARSLMVMRLPPGFFRIWSYRHVLGSEQPETGSSLQGTGFGVIVIESAPGPLGAGAGAGAGAGHGHEEKAKKPEEEVVEAEFEEVK